MALIIPKCNAESETLNFTLKVYYDDGDWINNYDLIDRQSKILIDEGIESTKKEPQSYTKKTQVLSYYKLIEWEDPNNNQSRRKITDFGKKLYEYRLANDKLGIQQLIVSILEQSTFGRNVLGCDSDSDLEAPNIFLKSALILGSLTNKEFAYILGRMELDKKDYADVLFEVLLKRKQGQVISPVDAAMKWADPKPILALADWGLFTTTKESNVKHYYVDNDLINNLGERLSKLRIKNTELHILPTSNNKQYNKTALYNDYIPALRTKPFMLLAGISGTGKSRIVRKLAQATIVENVHKKYYPQYNFTVFNDEKWNIHSPANFELIQVKPNWHNSMDVVGYLSSIPKPHYIITPFLRFISRAWENPEVPFFLCLDEMNLAPVEEYFAEFLSAIESRSFENGKYITDPIVKPFREFGEDVCKQLLNDLFPNFKAGDTDSELALIIEHFKSNGLTLPKNLIVIGTVNMDETTFSFSRKVLDRAMSIEMNKVDYNSFLLDTIDNELKNFVANFGDGELNDLLVNRHIKANEVSSELGADAEFVINYLERVNKLLDGTPFKLGYRAANEALIFVRAVQEFDCGDLIISLDNFTLMKILSRIEGDESKLRITDSDSDKIKLSNAGVNIADLGTNPTILDALKTIIISNLGNSNVSESVLQSDNKTELQQDKKLKSIKKIDQMISQLNRDHFVSYWN